MSRCKRVICHWVHDKDGCKTRDRNKIIINLDYITTVHESPDLKGDDEAHYTPSVRVNFSTTETLIIEGCLADFSRSDMLDTQPMDGNGRNIIGERIDAKKDRA